MFTADAERISSAAMSDEAAKKIADALHVISDSLYMVAFMVVVSAVVHGCWTS